MPRAAASGFAFLICAVLASHAVAAFEWLPIDANELKMTSEPNAPGAAAVYLYRQVDRSDWSYYEDRYDRIKILTEEGLKYADVEISYDGQGEVIRDIHARTIQPDGSTVDFDGKVFDKTIVQARGEKRLAKTFTLPNVQVGSIIEYRYRHDLRSGWIYDSRWIVSAGLFTEHAKFSLKPNTNFGLRWSWPLGVPPGSIGPSNDHGTIRLEARSIPAFIEEESMPPADELRCRVDFIYQFDSVEASNPDEYWKKQDRRLYREVRNFADAKRLMTQAVAQIVSPTDTPEEKLRKIYARVAQLHNLSYEAEAQQEANKEKPDSIGDVGDAWQKGYADGIQLTWLYLALVRAAGFEADPVLISTRDRYFFNKGFMNAGQLNSNLVIVKADGKEWYLDPGTPFTPFGDLPWWETGVAGLRLSEDNAVWISTPIPPKTVSRIERRAALKFINGVLTGKVTVTYTGLEASSRRLNERDEDATARKQYLEDEVQRAIPTGITVTLTNSPDWSSWDAPLVAEYEVEVPGWGRPAGRRVLVPIGLFGGEEKNSFSHAARIQPLYFANFYQHIDDITIELPAGFVVESLPKASNSDLKQIAYHTTLENDGQTLHFTRQLDFQLMLLQAAAYDKLRDFYHQVQVADADRAVLAPATGAAAGR